MGKKARPISVADCETDPFMAGRVPRPFIWGWYDGRDYREFDRIPEFMEFVTAEPRIVYAHNGGRFDWHFILDYIEEFTDVMVINGRLARFKIGECEFRDSWNIIPVPLAMYQKTEVDYSIFEEQERNKPENRGIIRSYLRDDCVFLFELVERFITEFGRGMTIAGTAMKEWSKVSGRKPPRDDGTLYQTLRPYYYGGRCQAFQTGIIEGPFQSSDINSAYPTAMLSPHPIGIDFMEYSASEAARIHDDDLATAFVKVRAESHGAFPMRQEDGSLAFPDDDERREFTITGHELIAALETDTIVRPEILGAYVFDEFCDFSDFITHFYNTRMEARKRGDKGGTLLYKLVMNSLYGKFAANPENYREFMTLDPELLDGEGAIEDEESERWEYAGDFGRVCLVGKPQSEERLRYFNLATGASITGAVRATLWKAICDSEGPIYCDTDAIAARDLSRLDYGPALGQWELEGSYDYGAVAGKKLYAFRTTDGEWKTASKGVRLAPSQIVNIAKGGEEVYAPDVPVFSIHKAPHFLSRRIRRTGLTAGAK